MPGLDATQGNCTARQVGTKSIFGKMASLLRAKPVAGLTSAEGAAIIKSMVGRALRHPQSRSRWLGHARIIAKPCSNHCAFAKKGDR